MKTFALSCLLIATAAVAFMPIHTDTALVRQRRDVSELSTPALKYLPPILRAAAEATTVAATTDALTELPKTGPSSLAFQNSAQLSDKGYEYQTVRRLKYRYRTRRDVSHLPALQYLPPNNQYLPPVEASEEEAPELISATAAKVGEVVEAAPKLAKNYLPPTTDTEFAETEAPETEATTVSTEQTDNEVPTELFAEVKQAPEESAFLTEDGYHYKEPAEFPPQLNSLDNEAYLPPIMHGEAIIVEGPAESAILADDGYHYRTIKRFRF